MTEQKAKELIVSFSCCGMYQLEILEELKGTSFYKHRVKQAINQSIKVLEPEVEKIIGDLFEYNEKQSQIVIEHYKVMMSSIAKMDSDQLNKLNQFMDDNGMLVDHIWNENV